VGVMADVEVMLQFFGKSGGEPLIATAGVAIASHLVWNGYIDDSGDGAELIYLPSDLEVGV
jgi:hypothetical protein